MKIIRREPVKGCVLLKNCPEIKARAPFGKNKWYVASAAIPTESYKPGKPFNGFFPEKEEEQPKILIQGGREDADFICNHHTWCRVIRGNFVTLSNGFMYLEVNRSWAIKGCEKGTSHEAGHDLKYLRLLQQNADAYLHGPKDEKTKSA